MIKKTKLGKDTVYVAYLKDNFTPTTKKKATLIKVVYEDGRSMFARKKK